MTLRRTQIELALEDLIRSQQGINFQRLATHLAKQKYSNLEPTEWFYDGGEDAVSAPVMGNDSVRRSLACSLTGTWKKVNEDCKRIADRKVPLDLLVFYTPVPVTNLEAEGWRDKVKNEYGHDIDVVGRARIVFSLEHPSNTWLCREYLGLAFADEPDLETLRAKVREVEQAALQQWKLQYGYDAARQIQLTLREESNKEGEKGNFLTLEECCETIRRARKVILKGLPGAGKTITLLQIAERLVEDHEGPVPIVLSLAEWAKSQQEIITFLSKRPNYQAANLSESQLASLNSAGRLVFLLNGWNEISVEATTTALLSLKRMIRDSPATAFLIATRDTPITPPVTDPITIRIAALGPEQRRAIVNASELADPATLLNMIERELALEEITRVPLFLAGIIELARQGRSIPGSRYGIIRALVDSTESDPDHAVPLKEGPCRDRHRDYLLHIAGSMCAGGSTTLSVDEILAPIGACSNRLVEKGIIGSPPDAQSVLDTLVSYHLLIGAQTRREGPIRFIHQQFQEWFAAEWLYVQFCALADAGEQESAFRFQKEFLNDPFWEEPLRFLSEKLNPSNGFESKSGYADRLIHLTIPVDLVLAATLSRLVGWKHLTDAHAELSRALRALYSNNKEIAQKYALACMLATGAADFTDIYEPILEGEAMIEREQFYRAWQPFPVSALGEDFSSRIQSWDEDRRAEFVCEIMFEPDATHYELVVSLARSDPSSKVWLTALKMLAWHGGFDSVLNILEERGEHWPEEVFSKLLGLIPGRFLARVLPRMKSALADLRDPGARLFILQTLDEASDPEAEQLLKRELERDEADPVLAGLLPRLYSRVPDRVSSWLGHKMLQGKYWDERWVIYLNKISPKLLESLAEAACQPDLDLNESFKRIGVLVKLNADPATKILVRKYLDLYTETLRSPADEVRDRRQTALGQIRDLPFDSLVRACRSIDEFPKDPYRVQALLHFLPPYSSSSERSPSSLDAKDRDWLRAVIYKWDASVAPLPIDQGGRRANLAALLGFIGTQDDVGIIEKWIVADSARVRETKSSMRYTNWYADALANLNCDRASQVLLRLVKEDPEYLGDASRALLKIVGFQEDSPAPPIFGGPDYRGVFEKRRLRQSRRAARDDESTRGKYAKAVLEAVTERVQQLKKENNDHALLWGMRNGTVPLAHLAGEECIPILLHAGDVDALTVLVTRGLIPPGTETFEAINPIISKLEAGHGGNTNNWYLAERCLALLLFSDQPKLGVDRIRQLPERILRSYKIREIIGLLGLCRAKEGAEYLAELAGRYDLIRFCPHEYLNAVVECRQKVAWQALLRILDDLGRGRIGDRDVLGTLVFELGRALGRIAKQDKEIWAEIRNRCEKETSGDAWNVLLAALQEVNTNDALLSACKLPRDQGQSPMWVEPPRHFQDMFTDQVPAGSQGSYYIRPRLLADVRKILLHQFLDDPLRKKSSLMLLIWIELLRFEVGKPIGEPRHPDIALLNAITAPWLLSG